jgi:large subunit ribosomal protein L27Ae
MRHFHKKANPTWKPTINLSAISKLIPKDQASSAKKGNAIPVVDLLSHGYAKLLGGGDVTVPMIVKARYVSEKAEKKLRKAGGAVVLQA